MNQDNPQNQTHGHTDGASGQNRETNHIAIATTIIGSIVTVVWVLPSVIENWDHWWMKILVIAFGVAGGYFVYAVLRRGAKWNHHKSFFAACALALIYIAIVSVAWIGGDMPAGLKRLNIKPLGAILLAAGILLFWLWQLRRALSETSETATEISETLASAFAHLAPLEQVKHPTPIENTPAPLPIPAGPVTLPDGRVVIQLDLSAIRAGFNAHMRIHAEKLFGPFIGKWTEVDGIVKNVTPGVLGSLSLDLDDSGKERPNFLLDFESSKAESLEVLQRGNKVSVRGQIFTITPHYISLRKCELI